MKTRLSAILIVNEEVDRMKKLRRRVRFCLFFVMLTAVAVGVFYYCSQLEEPSKITEGTLISSLAMELKQLCQ